MVVIQTVLMDQMNKIVCENVPTMSLGAKMDKKESQVVGDVMVFRKTVLIIKI